LTVITNRAIISHGNLIIPQIASDNIRCKPTGINTSRTSRKC